MYLSFRHCAKIHHNVNLLQDVQCLLLKGETSTSSPQTCPGQPLSSAEAPLQGEAATTAGSQAVQEATVHWEKKKKWKGLKIKKE